ncbi:MAG TPA: hypothetical protein VLM79_22515, partial [Kofleriaceae bacterium]|nr:hypothetical protein [Kofleriaceae bacterium]
MIRTSSLALGLCLILIDVAPALAEGDGSAADPPSAPPAAPAPAPESSALPTPDPQPPPPEPPPAPNATAAPELSEADFAKLAEHDFSEEVIVVTGSTIARRTLTTPAPLTIIDRELLDAAGHATLGDILQQLPAQQNGINAQINIGSDAGAT